MWRRTARVIFHIPLKITRQDGKRYDTSKDAEVLRTNLKVRTERLS